MKKKSLNHLKNKNEDDNVSMISNHEEAERISILKLIQITQNKVNDISSAFAKFSKKNSKGSGFMNIHDFNSFLSVLLELKLRSNNKRSLFNILDGNKDGYCKENDFLKYFNLTKEEIEVAINNPKEYMDGAILDLIIEQLYHEVVYFSSEGIFEIQSKLDKNGNIPFSKFEKQLSYFKVLLTSEEKRILENVWIIEESK